jgi:HD-like signal output (HDOD) protein
MGMEEIDGLERKVAQLVEILPPIPANISRLMTTRPDSNEVYKQVRALIDDDPGLCSDLLHLAGDICYVSGEPIETVDDALRHVGIDTLIQLIAVSYAGKIIRKEFARMKYLNDYFEHSRKISLSCQILAKLHDMPEHDRQMYAVAGLIHDIGRLIIMLASDKTTVGLLGTSWDKMKTIVKDEKEIFGMNHSEAGMQICSKWHFP